MTEHWWIAPGRRPDVEARCPLQVAAWMHPPAGARVLSSDRQSAAVRVPGDPPLLVKWRRTRPGRRRRTFLRASRERREARAALRLAAAGFVAPLPWAVGERRRRGSLQGAVLVRAFEADARTADAAAMGDPEVLLEVARHLRRWHDAGFRHGDCYPKNVLVGGAAAVPRPIGCPSARWRPPGPGLDRWRLKDLAQLVIGAAAAGVAEDGRVLLDAYGDGARLRPRVRPFVDRVRARKAARIATRPQREPDGPPAPVPLDPAAATVTRVVVHDLA